MADSYQEFTPGLESPARRKTVITPNDSTDLAEIPRALWIGTGGDLNCILADDAGASVIPSLTAGYHPLRTVRILDTNTTASGIVALY